MKCQIWNTLWRKNKLPTYGAQILHEYDKDQAYDIVIGINLTHKMKNWIIYDIQF